MKPKKKKGRISQYLEKIRYFGSLQPVSRLFGYDRGKPIDRYYIENFLSENSHLIKGDVLEVAERTYTLKFGGDKVKKSMILHPAPPKKKKVEIVGDLVTGKGIPENAVDCFIFTHTLNVIYNVHDAIKNAFKLVKKGGTILITVHGMLMQISRFDYQRWGHYWGFTDQSLRKLLEEVGPADNINIKTYGNVKIVTAFLYGLGLHEVKQKDLDYNDSDYQLVISAVVKK